MAKSISFNRKFNFRLVSKIQGSLLVIESLFFLLCALVAIYFGEETYRPFLFVAAISIALGLIGVYFGQNASTLVGKREGSIIVTLSWLMFSFIGLLPYFMSGNIPDYTDAFFETISGFTTTGASILTDIESMPKSLLLWRSMTHWIGGLGIIVITMAVLPIFGFQGSQFYTAEVTGLSKEKIHPRISSTAKILLGIYLFFTFAGIIALHMAGMNWFDAINHSLSSVSTGGFSTRNASISYWNSPAVEWVTIFQMTFSSINLSLYFFLIKGKFHKFFKDEELRTFLLIILTATVFIMFRIIHYSDINLPNLWEKFRTTLFTVCSLISTTGYYSVDYSGWNEAAFILLLLTFIGGSAGSTSGGVKVIRVLLVFKYSYYEFKRMIHPNAVFPVRYNGVAVKEEVITKMLAFLMLYIVLALIGAAVLCYAGLGFEESISSMVSCLGNVGPGLGRLGPIENYQAIPGFAKWFLSFAMLVGRLEFFTVLLIFTPAFWKK